MNKWLESLHRHFVPSEHNAYQPHFLRFKVAAGILSLVVVLEAFYLAQTLVILPKSSYFAAVLASVLVDQTNGERGAVSLGTLTSNPLLERAAQLKANDMAAKGYFAHDAPDGTTPWYWFDQAGYEYAAAGENLAVNFIDSKDVTDAWMRSPTHRANIMNGNYTEIGIATARGMYKGKEAIFVVQEFGRPSLIARQIESVAGGVEEAASSTAKALESMIASGAQSFTPPPSAKKSVVIPLVRRAAAKSTAGAPSSSPQLIARESTTTVAGAETAKLDIPTPAVSAPILQHARISKIDSLLASPRQVAGTFYFILAAIIALALILAVFIEIRIQHPHIIASGLLLLAITLSFVMLNSTLGSGVI